MGHAPPSLFISKIGFAADGMEIMGTVPVIPMDYFLFPKIYFVNLES
jgi:hypothetical protein